MNNRLQEHLKLEEQTAANALREDLLKQVSKEGTAAAASSPADDVSIPLCSRCNLVPIHGDLQVKIHSFCTVVCCIFLKVHEVEPRM